MLFGFCIVDRKLGNISVLHSRPKVENTLVYPQPGRRSPAAAGVQISKELDFPQLHDIYGIIKAPHVGLCWSLTCGKTDIKDFKEQNRFRYKDEDEESSMYYCLTHLCY